MISFTAGFWFRDLVPVADRCLLGWLQAKQKNTSIAAKAMDWKFMTYFFEDIYEMQKGGDCIISSKVFQELIP
jgi:hypothetical protein